MLGIMLVIWAFVLLTLAAARVTRLVVIDKITSGIRKTIIAKYGAGFWLTYLVSCVACSAIWVSAPAAVAWTVLTHGSWWWTAPAWLAMSYLAYLFVAKVDGD